eukprot:Gb_06865 [translate_table: standard]
MAAVVPPGEETAELLKKLSIDPQQKPAEASEGTHQPQAIQDGVGDGSEGTDTTSPGPSTDEISTPGAQDYVVDPSLLYAPNGYAQQAYYYGCYDGAIGEWEEYPGYVNVDGMEIPSPGVYGDSGSVMFHPGYGYPPQISYGSYSPAGTPVPSVRADGQLYGPQPFQYPGPFYQQPVSPSTQYIPSPTSVSPGDVSNSAAVNQGSTDGYNGNVTVNGNSPRSGYPLALLPSHAPYGRVVSPVPIPSLGYQDPRFGYDGGRISGPWADSSKLSEGHQSPASTNGYTTGSQVPTQMVPSPGHPVQNVHPHMMHNVQRAQQQWSPSGNGTGPGPMNRFYSPNRQYPQNNNSGRFSPGYGIGSFDSRGNGRSWIAIDKSKPRGRGIMFNGNDNLDVLNEQNRGPRTARFRNQQGSSGPLQPGRGQIPTSNGNGEENNVVPNREQYNRPEFVTSYSDAKFFIIKSYSEDDIHKSIKYNVWASTPNGNKKLDAAYKEAHEKNGGCPVFLFFSVNASGQFCGVAEMVGPVDFIKSVDYWQQDKWSGSFPVKWLIIKDVPNGQFRHITLENNDNKPVTNSRDTQEVKFEQGTEMLNIFKNYLCKTSILDDFLYYEGHQKTMQEKKARQQAQQQQQQQQQVSHAAGVESEVAENLQESISSDAAVENKDGIGSLGSADQSYKNVLTNQTQIPAFNERKESSMVAEVSTDGEERRLSLNA